MGKFRKKPIVIEAFKWVGGHDQEEDPIWIIEAIKRGEVTFTYENNRCVGLEIKTLEGVMRADPGDWIIQGVKGELYPCKPEIFEATYDLVE